MTAAAETKSPAVPARLTALTSPSCALRPDVERDDDEHPGADELDQRDVEQGVGEQEHDEPEHDRADRAKEDRAARVLGRQPAAGEGDDDGVVRAEQQVDKEDLQQEKEPADGVGHDRQSEGSEPPGSGPFDQGDARRGLPFDKLKASGCRAAASADRTSGAA